MAKIVSRLYPSGNFAIPVTGVFDEITGTSDASVVSRQDNLGNHYIGGMYDEVSLTSSRYSVYFDGTSGLAAPSSANIVDFGTGDFTVEAWVYPTADNGRALAMYGADDSYNIFSSRYPAGRGGFGWGIQGDTMGVSEPGYGTNYYFVPYGSSIGTRYFQYNTWYHVAITRASGTVKAFFNGIQSSTVVTGDSFNYYVTGGQIALIGASRYWFSGNISNLRIVKGTALYTSSFDPPINTLTAVSGTSLLTCQSTDFVDNSSNHYSLSTINNTPTLNNLSYGAARRQYPNGDYFISGVLDEVTGILSSTSFQFASSSLQKLNVQSLTTNIGTGDFTIEMWVYPTTTNTNMGLYWFTTTTGIQISSSNQIRLIVGIYAVLTDRTILPLNAWAHVALVKISGITKLYVNGISNSYEVSYTDGNNYNSSSANIPTIGWNPDNAGQYFDGYISNIRHIRGIGLYTGNFTPPKLEFGTTQASDTNIVGFSNPANTILLTCQSTSIVDNSINHYTINNINGVTISTTVSPV